MTTTPERTATLTSLVAAEIRAWMGRLDVRQSVLARRIGETDQWMSMRLKGRTPIDVNELHRIASALGVGVHQLLPAPEIAARAADPQAMARYLEHPVRTTDRPRRPPDNRPSGRPVDTRPPKISRTAYLARASYLEHLRRAGRGEPHDQEQQEQGDCQDHQCGEGRPLASTTSTRGTARTAAPASRRRSSPGRPHPAPRSG